MWRSSGVRTTLTRRATANVQCPMELVTLMQGYRCSSHPYHTSVHVQLAENRCTALALKPLRNISSRIERLTHEDTRLYSFSLSFRDLGENDDRQAEPCQAS